MILSPRHLFTTAALLLLPLAAALPVEQEAVAPPPETPPTVIESDKLEMVTREGESHFVFSQNVKVTGNNLTVTCDQLEVHSAKSEDQSEGVAEIGSIQMIVAAGNVRMEQEGRVATSGRAELFPQEGRVVLLDSPVIHDLHGTGTGARIILYQGEGRAVIEGDDEQPVRITLPTLPDLGAQPEPDRTAP